MDTGMDQATMDVLRGEMDQRFTDLRGEMDQRFTDLRGEMDQRFNKVDLEFAALRGEMDRRFNGMEVQLNRVHRSMTAWVVGTVISCVTVTSLLAFSLINVVVGLIG